MQPRYINELAEGSSVDGTYVLKAKELRTARNGDSYLWMEMADRTGSIPAVWFRPSAESLAVPVGSIIAAKGIVTSYRGRKRMRADSIAPASTWDAGDFVRASSVPASELQEAFRREVRSIMAPDLRKVVTAVFAEDGFFDRFAACPGSASSHHVCIGGLIEHTLAVVDLCRVAAARCTAADQDMLVSAALLHDVGRVEELAVDTSISLTDRGRLIGHAVMGSSIVSAAARRVGLEPKRATALEHAVLSHHSDSNGAAVLPATIEALILHHADALDSQADGFAALLSSPLRVGESWTGSDNVFSRSLHAVDPGSLSTDADSGVAKVHRISA
jgi:3'-5' exoribonuclease